MAVIHSVFWYLRFVVSLILLIPKMFKYKKLTTELPFDQYIDDVNYIVTKWASSHVKFSHAKFNVTGCENVPKDGSVLFVSNHQSDFDIAIFMCFIPRSKGYVAKVQLLQVPLLRTWMKYLGCIFLDRSDMRKSAKAINECIALLKNGYSMVIFPEGTRSKTGEMGEFKPGSFKLATKSKAPIVPVTIIGSRNIMEGNNYIIKPSEVTVIVHPAVYTDNLTKEEESALPNKIWNIINAPLKTEHRD